MNDKGPMKKRGGARRVLCLLLCLLMLLPTVLSCGKKATVTETPSLALDASGEATFSVALTKEQYTANRKGSAALYELLPGESFDALAGREPIAVQKVKKTLQFTFPLATESGENRLYRSYTVILSDGTTLGESPIGFSDPSPLATRVGALPNDNRVKGIAYTTAEQADELLSPHVLLSVSLSSLINGEDLSALIASVGQARAAGKGVALRVIDDHPATASETATAADGILGAMASSDATPDVLILGLASPVENEADAALVSDRLRVLYLALCSRVSKGRVFVELSGSADELVAEAERIYVAVNAKAPFPFGVGVSPTAKIVAGALHISELVDFSKSLRDKTEGRVSLCVTDMTIPATNEDTQAAVLTYAYRAALQARAERFFYEAVTEDASGLYAEDGSPRLSASIFRLMDTNQNSEGELLADEILSVEWQKLSHPRPELILSSSYANVGTNGEAGRLLFDFSTDDTPAISVSGGLTAATLLRSELWNSQVLTASLAPSALSDGSGYRFSLESGKDLKDLHVLSVNLLPQAPTAEQATVTLRLDGVSTDGRALCHTAAVDLPCNGWQTVSFHIRDFTSSLDTSKPCEITLLMRPDSETAEESWALWVHSFHGRAAERDTVAWLVLLLTLVGFGIGTGAVLLLSRRRLRRARR